MNPANLPLDSEAMLEGLRTWVECESPTWDAGAVNRMLDIAARDMAIMGVRPSSASPAVRTRVQSRRQRRHYRTLRHRAMQFGSDRAMAPCVV